MTPSFFRIARANLGAAALWLAASAFAADAPAPAPSVEAQVQALVAKLHSDDPDERTKALEALVALGPGARAPLEAAQAQAKDMDLKAQLHLALEGLDAGSAMARYEHPKTIDLAAKGLRVKDALERLHKHFGWRVNADDAAAAKPVDLELKGATFFQAVEAIRAGANLAYASTQGTENLQVPSAGPFTFRLVPAAHGGSPAAFVSGPFLLYLDRYSFFAMRSLVPETGAATEQKMTSLLAMLVTEPGVPASSAKIVKGLVKDAKGNVLFASQDDAENDGFGMEENAMLARSVYMQWQAADEPAGPLAWTGEIAAHVPLKMETLRVEDLESADQKPLVMGEARVAFEKPRKDGEHWSVTYTETMGSSNMATGLGVAAAGGVVRSVASASAGASSEHANDGEGVLENEEGWFWLDEKGRRLQTLGQGGGGSETQMRWHVTLSGKPKSVVIRKVTKSAPKAYAFAFEAIPAPGFAVPAQKP